MNWTANRVKRLRKRAELTQEGMAKALKVSAKSIHLWENAKFAPDPTSVAKLNRLARRVGFLR